MDLILMGLAALRGKLNVDIKVLSMLQSGEPDHFKALWPFAEGLFCFL